MTVDQSTGTVTLRAIVPNPDDNLLPGMYVTTTLAQGVDQKAILMPQQGVSRNSSGQASCLLVGPSNKVTLRNITVAGAANGDRWRVTAGLESGDRVIIQGTDQARPGQTVTPVAVTFDKNGNIQAVKASARKSLPAHKPRIEATGS